jgi:hypothetical protein
VLRLISLLLLSSLAWAQTTDVEWAVALGGRFGQLHDPVVAAYALGRLGETVCAKDAVAGAGLFRDSLARLRLLTPATFTSARRPLPVPSFTALWKTLTPAAAKCNPELQSLADTDRARAKMLDERQQAPDNLTRAFSLVNSDPDRAAQLARAAISASDPELLDIATLTLLLSNLRDRAADVADDLFPDALDFIASAPQPDPGLLLELGKYLFTAPKYRELPDVEQQSDVSTVGSTSIANFTANRKSASSDDIRRYIDAMLKVVTASNDPYYDPVAAYAIAFQMLPTAEDVAPDLVDQLREVLDPIQQLAGDGAARVQAAVGGSQAADPEGGEGPRQRDRLVGRVLSKAASRQFAEARDLLRRVNDLPVRSQAGTLIDFAESAAALERRDTQWSFTLANTLRPGVKRSLLYAGLVAAARDGGEALGYAALALREIELLPAEQRMLATAALAGATFPVDADNAFSQLNLFVQAANDAYRNPHQARFDPQVIRRQSAMAKTTTFTDSSLILANSRCLCEAVDTGRGRHSFTLKVPGLQATGLTGVVRNASGVDTERLEAILLGLRDETLMAAGLNALAALRLGR